MKKLALASFLALICAAANAQPIPAGTDSAFDKKAAPPAKQGPSQIRDYFEHPEYVAIGSQIVHVVCQVVEKQLPGYGAQYCLRAFHRTMERNIPVLQERYLTRMPNERQYREWVITSACMASLWAVNTINEIPAYGELYDSEVSNCAQNLAAHYLKGTK